MNEVILYGDISPNIIDGSSIWLMSMTETLSKIFDVVHVQLKAPIENDLLTRSISNLQNIVIHKPNGTSELTADEACSAVVAIDQNIHANAIVVRGIEACNTFCQSPRLASRLWSYVTELPFPPSKISQNNLNRINRIAQRSQRMFTQTEAARSYLETLAPAAAGNVVLLNPILPDALFKGDVPIFPQDSNQTLRLVYAGKLASDWYTFEMLELPRQLRKFGVDAELRVVGAKFNRNPDDSTWVSRMKERLETFHADPTSGVTWVGARSRAESLEEIRSADIGIGWRTPRLDSSLEISTKALEYMAAGILPVVNRTEDHSELLGTDYPLLVQGSYSPTELASHIAKALPELQGWNKRVREASRDYSMNQTVRRLEEVFTRSGAITKHASPEADREKVKVVIASHDMKFMGELMDYLERHPDFEVRQDAWTSLHVHDVDKSLDLLQWADTIFCEWAGPSLAWYSNNKSANTRLVCRLHRFELDGPWLKDVKWENVDQMIFVSELYRRMALEKLPIERETTRVIPNAVDSLDFDRPKTKNARFTLGFVGMVPIHKRPDRALDLLEALLEHDDRYTLRFKGRMPWEYSYEWNKPVQKQLYLEFFDRIASNKDLQRHIVFDDFSPDIANWQRNIGFILSPSEVESFHMAPAEGMAGRSIPIFWPRPGVDEIFGTRFIAGNLETAVSWILQSQDLDTFQSWGEDARKSVLRWDPIVLMPMWEDALGGNRPSTPKGDARWDKATTP